MVEFSKQQHKAKERMPDSRRKQMAFQFIDRIAYTRYILQPETSCLAGAEARYFPNLVVELWQTVRWPGGSCYVSHRVFTFWKDFGKQLNKISRRKLFTLSKQDDFRNKILSWSILANCYWNYMY
jgi:hypothetical protein